MNNLPFSKAAGGLIGGLMVLVLSGCGDEQRVVTDVWPDGSPKREATVIEGDTTRVMIFDSKGNPEKSSEWKAGKRHGTWEAYYPDGTVWSRHIYREGVQTGAYETWHPNGQRFIQGAYDDQGIPTGVWKFFDETGRLIQEKSGSSIHNPS